MAADPDKLAIFVTSPQNMTHIVGLAEAAARAEKKPMIFFTYKSIHLTKDARFKAVWSLATTAMRRIADARLSRLAVAALSLSVGIACS